MLFNNNDFDFTFFEIPGSDFKLEIDRSKFVNPNEGFQIGNLLRDEYIPYKNYNAISFVPANEQEKKMYEVMKYAFAIVDLNLYLDVHPEDEDAYHLLQRYVEDEKKVRKEYNEMFGPVEITNVKYQTYQWDNNPWPWDNLGGGMYV